MWEVDVRLARSVDERNTRMGVEAVASGLLLCSVGTDVVRNAAIG